MVKKILAVLLSASLMITALPAAPVSSAARAEGAAVITGIVWEEQDSSLMAAPGTPEADLALPQALTAEYSDGTLAEIAVSWVCTDEGGYLPDTTGVYTFRASAEVPEGIELPEVNVIMFGGTAASETQEAYGTLEASEAYVTSDLLTLTVGETAVFTLHTNYKGSCIMKVNARRQDFSSVSSHGSSAWESLGTVAVVTDGNTFTYTPVKEGRYDFYITLYNKANKNDYLVFRTDEYETDPVRSVSVSDKVKQIVAEVIKDGMSDREKALALHDWIIYHTYYDLTYTKYQAENVFLDGTATCNGYANAYQLLLNAAGIKNVFVEAHACNHSWNLLQLDGGWYHVDCTWDDPSGKAKPVSGKEHHRYFLLTDAQMRANGHEWNTVVTDPKAASNYNIDALIPASGTEDCSYDSQNCDFVIALDSDGALESVTPTGPVEKDKRTYTFYYQNGKVTKEIAQAVKDWFLMNQEDFGPVDKCEEPVYAVSSVTITPAYRHYDAAIASAADLSSQLSGLPKNQGKYVFYYTEGAVTEEVYNGIREAFAADCAKVGADAVADGCRAEDDPLITFYMHYADAQEITAVTMDDAYSTMTMWVNGALPAFPETLTGTLLSGDTVSIPVTWYTGDVNTEYMRDYEVTPAYSGGQYYFRSSVKWPTITLRPIRPEITSISLGDTISEKTFVTGTRQYALGLPSRLTAQLSDGTSAEVGVDWKCSPAYTPKQAGVYEFTASYGFYDYNVSSSADLPTITVTLEGDAGKSSIVSVSLGENPSEKTIWTGTAPDAIGLPKSLSASLSDDEEEITITIPVTWNCTAKYDPAVPGEYVFVSAYSGADYTVEEGVVMPSVTVTVVRPSIVSASLGEVPSEKTVRRGTAKDALALPGTLIAAMSDGCGEELPFTWNCEDYDADTLGSYEFTAVYAGGDYKVEEGAVMPVITVTVADRTIASVTLGDNPSEKTVCTGTEKDKLGLPEKLPAMLTDGTTSVQLAVDWNCGNYDASAAGSYVFTASYTGNEYAIGTDVTMPAITVTVKEKPAEQASITSVSLGDCASEKTVYLGTGQADIGLPSALPAVLSDGTSAQIAVSWSSAPEYDAHAAGTYVFTPSYTGTEYTAGEGVEWPTVTVTAKAQEPEQKDNTITASSLKKYYSKNAMTLSIGAKCLGGAKLTYKSDSSKITVSSDGKVTVTKGYIGRATITITAAATDEYAKTAKKITVTILPPKRELTSLTNSASKTMKAAWKTSSVVTGYQLEYSTSKSFSDAKRKTVTKNTTAAISLKDLTKGKTYYVRIRTYKTVSGTKFWSEWSDALKVKIAK